MEFILFVADVVQNITEQAASYRLGQTVLRYLDKTLWIVEKCARWAVPPPLDQDDRPQPELIRPLPWIFFLPMLVMLRITRESISLINLVFGKPPLRSADVVMFIQSRRRYLRTLKYQGNRIMRARTSSGQQNNESWFSSLQSMFDLTLCFRRHPLNYGNNNTTRVSNNEQILVVKRSKRGRQDGSPVASTSEATMERLIEKMMVDLDADSDDDSSYTLTNAASVKSSTTSSDSDQDSMSHSDGSTLKPPTVTANTPELLEEEKSKSDISPTKSDTNSILEKTEHAKPNPQDAEEADKDTSLSSQEIKTPHDETQKPLHDEIQTPSHDEIEVPSRDETELLSCEEAALPQPVVAKNTSPKDESLKLLESEKCSPQKAQRSPKKEQKIANGRTIKNTPNKKKGGRTERRDSDVPLVKVTPADDSFQGEKENIRQPHLNDQ